jgi:hypothetical protein
MAKRGRVLTSLSRARFDELRQGIVDGSLAEKWKELEDKPREELTRGQTVELRQLAWVAGLFESDSTALGKIAQDKTWREIKVFALDNGMAETVTFGRG